MFVCYAFAGQVKEASIGTSLRILLFIFQFFDEDEDVDDDVLKMMLEKMIPLFTLLSANFPTVAFVGN